MASFDTLARRGPDGSAVGDPVDRRRQRLRATLSRVPADLALFVVIAAVSSTTWALLVPALQGPDEAAHASYVQRIAETRELPQKIGPGAGFSTDMLNAAQWGALFPMIGNVTGRPGVTPAEVRAYERSLPNLPGDARSNGTGFTSAATNPPLYYLYDAIPYALAYGADTFNRLLAMRLGSVLLLLVAIVCTWLLTAEVLPSPRWARTLAAGIVAVHPELSFLAGTVNPDLGLTALWSAGILASVRLVRRGATTGRVVVLGLLCAAATLTQPRGVPLAAPAALALALALWLHRPRWQVTAAWGALFSALVLLGAAAYYYVVAVYGGGDATNYQLNSTVGGGFNVREFLSYLWQFYLPKLGFMQPFGPDYGFSDVYVRTFFGAFASLEVTYPEWVLSFLRDAVLAGLLALIACLVVRRRAVRRHWATLAVLVIAFLAMVISLHVSAYRTIQIGGGPVLVGRYLFPLISLFGLAIAFVATSLPRRLGPYVGAVVLASGVVLQMTALGITFLRFYG